MKTLPNRCRLIMLVIALTISPAHGADHASAMRQPVWAGRFYAADPSRLGQHIDRLTRKAQRTRIRIPAEKPLRAIVLPHAGYIYSGWTAAHAARVLSAHQFSKVVLLGPDHRLGIPSAAISDVTAYKTPLGPVRLHRDVAKLRLQTEVFDSLPANRDREHSLEVILPFLQRYLENFELVPVIIGQGNRRRIAQALEPLLDHDTLLVISSDLSHYLAYAEAIDRDRATIAEIVNRKPDTLINTTNRACGRVPLLILTEIAQRLNWQPLLLHYSNSGDTAGDRARVVGYASIAYFGDLSMNQPDNPNAKFSNDQGQVLVKLARNVIATTLGGNASGSVAEDLGSVLQDECFQLHCGTFVTLKLKGQLRGCIGNLTSSETVIAGVKRNAVNAAFHDPRFPPLTREEFDRTEIEVSVLTEPQPLTYRDAADLIAKLRPHVDGVIIRKKHASATFLPQVWEQLPEAEKFLSHLCLKAGLPSDDWRHSELEVLTYQVQYFEEHQ